MEMPRQGVALAADREQMQVERQKRLERCVEPANPRGDCVRARQRRSEIERRTQDLHEHAVRDAVAVRPAARAQHAHARRQPEALLQFVQQPALAGASFADDRDDGP